MLEFLSGFKIILMKNFGGGIGGGIGVQIKGEIGQLAKDVGKAFADVPKQILEGPDQQKTDSQPANPNDQVGKALEQGQATQDPQQAQNQANYGWGASLKSQLGMSNQHQQVQNQLREIRRNSEMEMKQARDEKKHEEDQKKQQAEWEEEQKKKAEDQQKAQARKSGGMSKIQQMLGMGKGERKGTKGK